jgi:hypothetical protein
MAASGDGFGTGNPLGREVPRWVTKEINRYGIATGGLKAVLHQDDDDDCSQNSEWLTDEQAQQKKLRRLLRSGDYVIEFPEHGALLARVALLDAGFVAEADAITNAIAPWLDTLQFFPVEGGGGSCSVDDPPSTSSAEDDGKIQTNTVGGVVAQFESMSRGKRARRAAVYHLSVTKKRALHDAIVTFFLGTTPDHNEFVRRVCREQEDVPWPCQVWPLGWLEEAKDLVARADALQLEMTEARKVPTYYDYYFYKNEATRASPPLLRRHGGGFLSMLRKLVADSSSPSELSGRDVGMIRRALADSVRKRESRRCNTTPPPRFGCPMAYAGIVAARINAVPREQRQRYRELDLPKILAPISEAEARSAGVPASVREGDEIPATIKRIARTATRATLEVSSLTYRSLYSFNASHHFCHRRS